MFILSSLVLLAVLQSCSSSEVSVIERESHEGDIFIGIRGMCTRSYCADHGGFFIDTGDCRCGCYYHKPVFLQHIGKCSNNIEGCVILPFKALGRKGIIKFPLIFPPEKPRLESMPLALRNVSRKFNLGTGQPICKIQSSSYLTIQGWQYIEPGLFGIKQRKTSLYLAWLNNSPRELNLAGRLILLRLSCGDLIDPSICIALRIFGREDLTKTSAANNKLFARNAVDRAKIKDIDTDNQPGRITNPKSSKVDVALIVGVVCGAVIVLLLVAAVGLWTICWKRKKMKLRKSAQMRRSMLQRYQQEGADGDQPYLDCDNKQAKSSTSEQPDSCIQTQDYPSSNPFASQNTHGEQKTCSGGPWTASNEPGCQHSVSSEIENLAEHSPSVLLSGKSNNLLKEQNCVQLSTSPPLSRCAPGREQNFHHYGPDQIPPNFPSPSFLSPELVGDTDAITDEYLKQLRKLIDLAKVKIRAKRYIPSLLVIAEEPGAADSSARGHASLDSQKSSMNSSCGRNLVDLQDTAAADPYSSLEYSNSDKEDRPVKALSGYQSSPGDSIAIKTARNNAGLRHQSAQNCTGLNTVIPNSIPASNSCFDKYQHSPSVTHKVTNWLSSIAESDDAVPNDYPDGTSQAVIESPPSGVAAAKGTSGKKQPRLREAGNASQGVAHGDEDRSHGERDTVPTAATPESGSKSLVKDNKGSNTRFTGLPRYHFRRNARSPPRNHTPPCVNRLAGSPKKVRANINGVTGYNKEMAAYGNLLPIL